MHWFLFSVSVFAFALIILIHFWLNKSSVILSTLHFDKSKIFIMPLYSSTYRDSIYPNDSIEPVVTSVNNHHIVLSERFSKIEPTIIDREGHF